MSAISSAISNRWPIIHPAKTVLALRAKTIQVVSKNHIQDKALRSAWDGLTTGGSWANQPFFDRFLQTPGRNKRVLNCAVPLTRALRLTETTLPANWDVSKCLRGSMGLGFALAGLKGWEYTPKIRAVPQPPYLQPLPNEYSDLMKSPWFQRATPALGPGANARHLRYNHELWQELKPRVLQGVQTTIVFVTPQLGYSLTPHIKIDKAFNYFAALSRSYGPAQLFPASYLFLEANLAGMADVPAAIFTDLLPTTGGSNFPVMDGEAKPTRVFANFENADHYFGYPFSQLNNAETDVTLRFKHSGLTVLPNGQRVHAREHEMQTYATLDARLKTDLCCDRRAFIQSHGLVRGVVTHDGLPFELPVELQAMVFAITVTHWRLELDKPGDLTSYTLKTKHAAIRGFNYYQRVEPYYRNFQRLIQEITKDPKFKVYPLATHLTHGWLGGNLLIANQLSAAEQTLDPNILRNYYLQQLDWQAGVINLWNHISFRKGTNLESRLGINGLALHQMQPQLQFDSRLFQKPLRQASVWPELHPGWKQLDTTGVIDDLEIF